MPNAARFRLPPRLCPAAAHSLRAALVGGALLSLPALLALPLVAQTATGRSATPATTTPATASFAQRAAVDSIFARFNSTASPGCIVGVNRAGAPLLRQAYGMADLERGIALRDGMMLEIGSVSKQFVAALLVLLEQQGRLSLDDPAAQYLPGFPAFADAGGPITIRHLLQHTSGLRDQYTLLELVGRPYGEVAHDNFEVLQLINRQRGLNFPVNSRYLYSNTGYTLAAIIAQRVTRESFQPMFERMLFQPLGIERARWRTDFRDIIPDRAVPYAFEHGNWTLDWPFSNLFGAGALLTTIDGMMTWTEALHAGRVGNGSTLATMTRLGVLSDGSTTEYGLGLMVRDWRGVHEVAHSGSTAGYRAYLARYPAQDLTVAMQCNAGNGDYVVLARAVAAVFLGSALSPAPTPAVATAAPARAAVAGTEFRALVGRWQDAETGGVLEIAAADSGVTVTTLRGRRIPMRGDSRDRLVGGGWSFTLERDARGRVRALRLDAGRVLGVRFTKLD
ncbi:MAG: beta-lactamase family protein [Gemmatimonadaceae bacterium]|nr:beta-lactamase family protein [Gemmatimonadaceae bacterium]